MKKPKINFYDLKAKKKFSTDNFKVVKKGGRYFATTKAPSGAMSWLIISKDNAKKWC